MNLRIGDHDTVGAGPVRDGAAVRRSRTALSDLAAEDRRAREKDQGVVVRISSQARQLLAEQGGAETTPVEPALPAGPGGGDGETGTPGGQPQAPGDAQTNPLASPSAAAKGTDGTTAAGPTQTTQGASAGPKKLTDEDKRVISELAARDTAVHAHEAAHQAAAGGLGGGASFTYETGPDGRRYAVGGEVPVSLRSGRTPQETIANAQTVRSAALAPADPSSQDMAVAAQASQMEAEARQELAQAKNQKGDGDGVERAPVTRAPSRHSAGGAARAGAVGSVARAPAATGTTAPAGVAGSAPAPSQVAAETTADTTATGAAANDSEHDSLMIFSTLKAERGIVNGHLHSSGAAGCAFCSRAAARYA